jgi:beta-phosphoglucomutase
MEYAAIFDVDGVLVDSYQAHFESWKRLAEETGTGFSEDDFASTFGRRSPDIIRSLGFVASDDDEDAAIRRLAERKEELYREIVSEAFPAMEGAVELIDALGDEGFLLAAGSSAPPANVELTLDKLGRRESFGAVMTGHDVSRGKPHPEVFLRAVEALGRDPGACVVIEDAPAGIEAAHAAGMACVGLASTGRTRDELSNADLVVDALPALTPERLRRLIDDRRG